MKGFADVAMALTQKNKNINPFVETDTESELARLIDSRRKNPARPAPVSLLLVPSLLSLSFRLGGCVCSAMLTSCLWDCGDKHAPLLSYVAVFASVRQC